MLKDYFDFLRECRRVFHANAETAFNEKNTVRLIKKYAENFCCKVSDVAGGVLLFFDCKKGRTLLFRSEEDGLPIKENTGLDFAAQNGNMHACGHDGHIAVCLGLAKYVDEAIKKGRMFSRDVAVLFQPAEEGCGGMAGVIDSGQLDKLNLCAAFALHVMPDLKKGKIFTRSGGIFAGTTETDVIFVGKERHIAAQPKENALAAASEFVLLSSRYGGDGKIFFGKINGGSARNVVCGKVTLNGSVRFFSTAAKKDIMQYLNFYAQKCAQKYDCKVDIQTSEGIPPVINDDDLYQKTKAVLKTAECKKFLYGDDFGMLGGKCPCLYCLLGAGDVPPLHCPEFCFDEKILIDGLDFFVCVLGASQAF